MRITISMLILLLASAALAACANAPAATTSGNAPSGYKNLTPAQLNQMLATKDFLFVNVHIPYEGEIAQTDAFIPFDQVEQNLAQFPADKNAKIVLYCRSGSMSRTASETLVKLGYTNLSHLDGGMVAWENAGLPRIRK
ncbi:MAG: rhodanese-like domain-containing protein [Chloroflexi bacterium]|nr:rhodanese-like domain-containing protein [Chloroflexota bacterium]